MRIVIASGMTVGLAEGIIDDTHDFTFFFQGVVALVYMLCYEILLKKTQSVTRWEDVTIFEEDNRDEVVFTESNSPSESVMNRSVYVEIPSSRAMRISRRQHQQR